MLKRTQGLKKGTPLKSNSQLKRGGKLKTKKKTQEELGEEQALREADMKLYSEVWAERGPYSQISGEYLGEEVNKACCDHLLEKSVERYKHLRHEKENIYLVTIAEHQLKTNGFPLPKHKEAVELAKIKFNVV